MSNEFKLVPVEPTDEMLQIGCDSYFDSESSAWTAMAGAYKAMLAAAPKPPALGGEPDPFVREVFLRNGFTIKEGQTDLKSYVYAAAKELTDPLQAEIERLKAELAGSEKDGAPC